MHEEQIVKERITRMKTVEQCFAEIKKLDENTAITSWFIRRLCKENKVKHFMTGTKILVNYDDLLQYLNFEKEPVSEKENKNEQI